MKPIPYIDRETGQIAEEKVYGGKALTFLYGEGWLTRCLGRPLSHFLAKNYWISAIYGFWQKQYFSKKKIRPFIQEFKVDTKEFAEDVAFFNSFNDFFIRKLKPEARPIDADSMTAVIPADARYWFYQENNKPIIVKGQSFHLNELLKNQELAARYAGGAIAIARLCPTDYHRFHFPADCLPSQPTLLNGPLYSVNPLAIRQNLSILSENKRMLTLLQTEQFGQIAYLEIGAQCVGTIVETFTPGQAAKKGAEKGYFSFGGSALILLFEPGRITFSPDLLEASQRGLEVRCLLGQRMGKIVI